MDYIYELYKANMQKQMEQDFENEYLRVKATFHILPTQKDMRIVIVERRNFHFICSYIVTDFDCVNENWTSTELLELPKHEVDVDFSGIRKWYLRWMNKHFTTYKQDYINHVNKIANKDLGIDPQV